MEGKAPAAFVDPEEFNEVMKKLEKIDEKVEFVNSEVAQRIG
ncbi:MAG: tetrahydromethanopterin S-methyltransferase subunit G, partial [Methanosarcina sp.]|nr:tetrahydromethanopterin S-methyltransferase subunit G [Methanosarcina sp.]